MRIAEIATLAHAVPPRGEGSIELLVSLITEGLVQRGHDVTLFATADSQTAAKLVSPVPVSYTQDPQKWDWQLYEALQVKEAFQRWHEFDIIHCHSYHFGLLFCDLVDTPSLHSIHTLPGHDLRVLAERTRNRYFHFASNYQARELEVSKNAFVVPHGVNLSRFYVSPTESVQNYVVFMGRFTPDKGPLEAIALAKKAGLPIKVAGPSNEYFREKIQPLVDGTSVQYVGEVAGDTKSALLSRARALLYTVQRGEPFGLVLLEAMASGLPVVAFDKGAVREIINHNVTGWIGRTQENLLTGLDRVSELDRSNIRAYVEERYSVDSMIAQLEKLMTDIVNEQQLWKARVF